MTESHIIFGVLSVLFAAIAYPPYVRSMLKGKTKPHAFSWLLWTLLTWVAFVIQVKSGAGAGAWATGFTAFCTTIIAVMSLKYGEKDIRVSDTVSFAAGLLAIPLWILTKDPTWSAILVTAIDAFGFYPTFRKSWKKPHEEMVVAHALSAVKHTLSVFALTAYTVPTAFYPVCLVLMNVLLVTIIVMRRRIVAGESDVKKT